MPRSLYNELCALLMVDLVIYWNVSECAYIQIPRSFLNYRYLLAHHAKDNRTLN